VTVRFLEELCGEDLPLAGGKGANLGELVRGGFPVPRGFVLTTEAYRAAVEPPDLNGLVLADNAALEAAAARIRARIEAAPVPDAVTEAYARLGSPVVAVRSSATAEDLPDASFAGQQDTYLGISGVPDLVVAVARCWASLWTVRAIRYRAERGIDSRQVALAVVVQEMAPHDIAGVVFTANPLTGRRTELLVNAVRGSGEMLVGGEVVPDQWVARRPDGAVTSFTPARRGARRGSLGSEQVRELAELALRVEDHFGGVPQDIEWSHGNGCFYLLQARPITTLAPLIANSGRG
jgi:pyruvate,water dikinase